MLVGLDTLSVARLDTADGRRHDLDVDPGPLGGLLFPPSCA
jgi:hypothetical protein